MILQFLDQMKLFFLKGLQLYTFFCGLWQQKHGLVSKACRAVLPRYPRLCHIFLPNRVNFVLRRFLRKHIRNLLVLSCHVSRVHGLNLIRCENSRLKSCDELRITSHRKRIEYLRLLSLHFRSEIHRHVHTKTLYLQALC